MKDSEKMYIHPTRIFKTPEELHNTWVMYKESLEERKKDWPKVQYVGKDGTRQVDYPKLPLTLKGFYTFCRREGVGGIEQYFNNTNNIYDDFVSICRAIKDEIEDDLATGGLLMAYNPSLTARINGYADKQQITDSVIKIEGLPKNIEEDLDES